MHLLPETAAPILPKRTTQSYGEASQPGNPAYGINSAIGGRLMVVAGGIPVIVDGEVVGAVGVSSGTPSQDHECAQTGIATFLEYLNTK
ncbi:GlcG/HbpS family heme-binding protein [Agrobacterium tumefaciens]|uniref:GlcG/HbpS family heme-binding protein n=1 Tax=Agrobacterium tumefaciens TaxID=358 RepID=UPI001F40E5F7|nr:heme-binding protein [Agrobacterium tumefaciens]